MFQSLKLLPAHLGPWEGEVVGVLAFGVAGLVVLLVPFLDRGSRTRRMLNLLAMFAVAFFIVMTAWGWFSAEDEMGLRLMLGLLLVLIVLTLLVPFTDAATTSRRALYALLTLGGLILLGGAARELLS
jgi:quinol-cytochrome oxidoreductase complex cytochrome b subunit